MPKWKEWPLSWHWSLNFVPRTSCSLLVARKLSCFICQSSALKSRCLPATVCRGNCNFVLKPVTYAVFFERTVKSDVMVGPGLWGHKVWTRGYTVADMTCLSCWEAHPFCCALYCWVPVPSYSDNKTTLSKWQVLREFRPSLQSKY